MKNNKLLAMLFTSTVMSVSCAFAAPNYSVQQYQYQYPYNTQELSQPVNPYAQQSSSANSGLKPLQGSVVMIPSGTSIPAVTNMTLSSEFLTVGQSVSVPVANNFYYGNTLVAPSGSSINGTVIEAKKAGRTGINGQLMIKFTNILTPYGQMIPISGKIKTDDGTGLLRGGTKMDTTKSYAKDIAIGTAAGAIAGTIFGPLSGGKVGKGAALGTAVGATGGLAKSLWDRGIEVEIPAGSQIDIVFDQPVTFNPQQGYRY